MSPGNAVQAAIYQRLKGVLGVGVYDFLPSEILPPYVAIGDDTLVTSDTKTGNGWEATLTIHAWDFEKAGRKSVKAILGKIYDALHRQESQVAVAGFTLIEIVHEFEQTFRDGGPADDDRYYHGVQRYRATIEAA